MTLLSYEHHTDIVDVHDALYKFGLFAVTCGWTANYNLTDTGAWDTTSGTFESGDATFLMLSMDGTTCGNHAAQDMCYQFHSELRTGGSSGDQGTIRMMGRITTESKVIGDSPQKLTHPQDQFKLYTQTSNWYRFWCKGTAPPNVWFFGNERFLAMHYDNDGVSVSPFRVGTWDLFDKSVSATDITQNFLCNGLGYSSLLEWDTTNSARTYWYLPEYRYSLNYCYALKGVSYYYNMVVPDIQVDYSQASTTCFYLATIGNGRSYLFQPTTGVYSGAKMNYGSHRILVKPNMYWLDAAGGSVWRPLGQADWYYCYFTGLRQGGIITNGTRQFMVFTGFNPREYGIAYRIV